MSIYYNFSQFNDSISNKVVDKTDNRREALLDSSPDEWKVSLVKMNLPSQGIKAFRNDNTSNYRVKLGVGLSYGLSSATRLYDYSSENSLPLNSEFSYDSYQDTIEAINRTFQKTYREMLESYPLGALKVSVSDTFSFSKAIGSGISEHTENFTFTPTANVCDGKLGYIRISNLQVGTVGFDDGTGRSTSHSLYLVAPDGTECLVYANRDTLYSRSMIFADEYFDSVNNNANSITEVIPAGSYHPTEAFVKFSNNVDLSGTWQWKLVNKDVGFDLVKPFALDVAYTIDFFCPPIYDAGQDGLVSQIAPVVDHNLSTDRLDLILQERVFTSGMYIEVSPRLNELLGFPSVLNSSGDFCRIKLPQIANLSSSLDQSFRFSQPVPTANRLNNVKSIQLRSNTIPVIGEYDNTESSKIIMSIDKDSDFVMNSFEFASNNSLRTYDLIGQTPLTDMNLSVFVEYEDGETVRAELAPYSRFTALLKFEKK